MGLYNTLEELSDKVSKLRNHVATEGTAGKDKVCFLMEDYKTNADSASQNSISRKIPLYSG